MNETIPTSPPEIAEAVFERRKQLVLRAADLHYNYLLAFVRRFVSHHDAEDILQELLKYALIHIPEDKICKLPILRKKAYYLMLDHCRKRRRSAAPQCPGESGIEEPVASETQEQAFTSESEAVLQEKFWEMYPVELNENQRTVLWLHGRHGFTVQEISDRMQIPSSTVHNWIQRGREKLHDLLENN